MGCINTTSEQILEQYKGKIVGFTKYGHAAYLDGVSLQAIDTCECCGQVISSQISEANFCPLCAVVLGLVSEELAKDIVLPSWQDVFDKLDKDSDYKRLYYEKAEGFKAGIRFALKHGYCSLKGKIRFDI